MENFRILADVVLAAMLLQVLKIVLGHQSLIERPRNGSTEEKLLAERTTQQKDNRRNE